ncbi:hypothetical protein ETD86_45065 [Nonomuraea turkmeniaca]|uniref:Uncharacterized protein n=1 Tax=Nonomuraea turkmeniaca TaxID=103838 RepID=A0A5S4EZK8_9ACTN|nr:hypothetical protein [Nonomuraea turkmeniaca]TMR09086.1 hypothetical protein ETD86_45065 [Nonomuraea turkmeniaca]
MTTDTSWISWETKALGRAKFDADKHPRDRKGRFIETGAQVRVWGGGVGKVVKNVGGGRLEVKFPDGTIQRVHRNYLTVEKRPDGSAPTGKASDKPAELPVKKPTGGVPEYEPEGRDGRARVRDIRGRRAVLLYGRDPRTGDAVMRVGIISQVGRVIDGQMRVELDSPGGRSSLVVDDDAVARLIPDKPLQDLIAAVRQRDPNVQQMGRALIGAAVRDDDNEAGQDSQDGQDAPGQRPPAEATATPPEAARDTAGNGQPAGSQAGPPADEQSSASAEPAAARGRAGNSGTNENAPHAPADSPAASDSADSTGPSGDQADTAAPNDNADTRDGQADDGDVAASASGDSAAASRAETEATEEAAADEGAAEPPFHASSANLVTPAELGAAFTALGMPATGEQAAALRTRMDAWGSGQIRTGRDKDATRRAFADLYAASDSEIRAARTHQPWVDEALAKLSDDAAARGIQGTSRRHVERAAALRTRTDEQVRAEAAAILRNVRSDSGDHDIAQDELARRGYELDGTIAAGSQHGLDGAANVTDIPGGARVRVTLKGGGHADGQLMQVPLGADSGTLWMLEDNDGTVHNLGNDANKQIVAQPLTPATPAPAEAPVTPDWDTPSASSNGAAAGVAAVTAADLKTGDRVSFDVPVTAANRERFTSPNGTSPAVGTTVTVHGPLRSDPIDNLGGFTLELGENARWESPNAMGALAPGGRDFILDDGQVVHRTSRGTAPGRRATAQPAPDARQDGLFLEPDRAGTQEMFDPYAPDFETVGAASEPAPSRNEPESFRADPEPSRYAAPAASEPTPAPAANVPEPEPERVSPPEARAENMTPEQWQAELRDRYGSPEAADAVRDVLAIIEAPAPEDDDEFEDHYLRVGEAYGAAEDAILAIRDRFADEPGWANSYGQVIYRPNFDWLDALIPQVRKRVRAQAYSAPDRTTREQQAQLRAMTVDNLHAELADIDARLYRPGVNPFREAREVARAPITAELSHRARRASMRARALADAGDYDGALAALNDGERTWPEARNWDRIRAAVQARRDAAPARGTSGAAAQTAPADSGQPNGVIDTTFGTFRWEHDGIQSAVAFPTRADAEAALDRYRRHQANPPTTEQADTADIVIGDHLYQPENDLYDVVVTSIDDTPGGDRYARIRRPNGRTSTLRLPAGEQHTRATTLAGLRIIPGEGRGNGQPRGDLTAASGDGQPPTPDGLPALTPGQRTQLLADARREYVPDLLAEAERHYNAGRDSAGLDALARAADIAPDLAGTPQWQERATIMRQRIQQAHHARMAAISDDDLAAQLAAARRGHDSALRRSAETGQDDGDVAAAQYELDTLQAEADRRAAVHTAEPRPGGLADASTLQPGDRIRVVRRADGVRRVRSTAGSYLTYDDGEAWIGTIPDGYEPGQPVRLTDVIAEQSGIRLPRHVADPPEIRLDDQVERLSPDEAALSLKHADELRAAQAARRADAAANRPPRHPSAMSVRDLAVEYGQANDVVGARIDAYATALDAAASRDEQTVRAAEQAWLSADDALAQNIAALTPSQDPKGFARFRAGQARQELQARLRTVGGSVHRARNPEPEQPGPGQPKPGLPDGVTITPAAGKNNEVDVARPGDPKHGDKPLGQVGQNRPGRSFLRSARPTWYWTAPGRDTVGHGRYNSQEEAVAALLAYIDNADRPFPAETVHPSGLTVGDAIVVREGRDTATGYSGHLPGGDRGVIEQLDHNADSSWSIHVRMPDDRRLVHTTPVSTDDQQVERIIGDRPPLPVENVSPAGLSAGAWLLPDGVDTPAQVIGGDYGIDGGVLLRVRTADGRDDIIDTRSDATLRRAFPADDSGDVWENLSQSRLQPAHGNRLAAHTTPAWQVGPGDVIDLADNSDGDATGAGLPAYVARVMRARDTIAVEAVDRRGESHWITYDTDEQARRLVEIPADATLEQVPAASIRPGERLILPGELDGARLERVTRVADGWLHTRDDSGRTSMIPLGDEPTWRLPSRTAAPAKPRKTRTRKPKRAAPAVEEPPTARVRLRSDIRKRVLSLDIDTSADAPDQVREAAAMLRASQPMTGDHMRALGNHLRNLSGNESLPAARRRALARAAAWVDGSYARLNGYPEPPHDPHRAAPERSRADNLIEGDTIAVPEPDGTVTYGRVIATRPIARFPLTTVTIEHDNGDREERILASGVDVWLMPDLPPDEDVAPAAPDPIEHIRADRLEVGDTIRHQGRDATVADLRRTSPPLAATTTWQAVLDNSGDLEEVTLTDSGAPSVVRARRGARSAGQPWDTTILDDSSGDGDIPASDVQIGDRVTFGPEHRSVTGTIEMLHPVLDNDGSRIGSSAWVRTLDDDVELIPIIDGDGSRVFRHAIGGTDAPARIQRQQARRRQQEREREVTEALATAETALYADAAKAIAAEYQNRRVHPPETGDRIWAAAPDLVEAVWKRHSDDSIAEQVAVLLTDDADDEQNKVLAKRMAPLVAQIRERAASNLVQSIVNVDPLPGETYDQALQRMLDQFATQPPLVGRNIGRILAARDLTELDDVAPPTLPDLPDAPAGGLPARMAVYRGALPDDLADVGRKEVRRRVYMPVTLDDLEEARWPDLDSISARIPDIAPGDGGPGEHAMRHLAIIKAAGADVGADVEARAAAVDGYGDAVAAVAEADARIEAAVADIERIKADHARTRKTRLDTAAANLGYDGIDDLVARANADATSQAAKDRWKVITPAEFGGGDLPEVAALKDQIRADHAAKQAAVRTVRDVRRQATLDALAELRDVGGARLDLRDERGRRRPDNHKVAAMMRDAEQHFPDDWVNTLNANGPLTLHSTNERPHIDPDTGAITLNPGWGGGQYGRDQAVHELGHIFQRTIPGLAEAEHAYLWERTSTGSIGDRTRPDTRPIADNPDEVGYPDAFPHPYTGRIYGHSPSGEIFTTGVQDLFGEGDYLDDDMRAWTLGVLALLGTTPDGPQRDPLDGVDLASLSRQDLQDLLGGIPWGSPAYNRIMAELRGRPTDDGGDPLEGVNLDELSGEALIGLLGRVDDNYSVARITEALDEWEIEEQAERERAQRIEARIADGATLDEALQEEWGISDDVMRADNARALSGAGTGQRTEEVIRAEYDAYIQNLREQADAYLRGGQELNPQARARGYNSDRLWTSGSWDEIRANASDEFWNWIQSSGWMNYTEYRAQFLGRDRDVRAARRSREARGAARPDSRRSSTGRSTR